MSNIAQILDQQAAENPDGAAIREVIHGRTRTTTFAELAGSASEICEALRGSGIRPGDRILVLHPISAELYAIVLAVFRAGCTVMLLDPAAGFNHIARCCSLCPPAALIGSRKAHLLRLASGALRAIPQKFVIGGWVPGAAVLPMIGTNELSSIEPCADEQPALLTFTSGGTGLPKAAVRTHGFLLAQNKVLARTLELRQGERDLITLPVFVLANIAAGVTTIIPDCDLRYPGRIDTAKVLQQIADEQPRSTACSPAFIQRLATAAVASTVSLSSFQRIYTGGAPVTPELMDLIFRAAPHANVVAVYGSTEAEPIAELPLKELTSDDRANTSAGGGLPAGKPVSEITLRIIKDLWGTRLDKLSDAEFDDITLRAGERGEIVVTGDHVLKGYLDGRGDEETKFNVNGKRWHRTGDAGYMDDQERLWLLGRCNSVVRDGRGELYPFAVEMVALKHEAVSRAALLNHKGRRVLFIEVCPGKSKPDHEDINNLMPWAMLDDVRVLPEIPVDRRHNAKIDYPRLLAMLK